MSAPAVDGGPAFRTPVPMNSTCTEPISAPCSDVKGIHVSTTVYAFSHNQLCTATQA